MKYLSSLIEVIASWGKFFFNIARYGINTSLVLKIYVVKSNYYLKFAWVECTYKHGAGQRDKEGEETRMAGR